MATTKRSRTGSRRKSSAKARSYTILKKSTIDTKKKLSRQGKTKTTTKTGAHLAARVALAKTKRPSRIYLYRHKKIMTYSIRYAQKDGKVKAVAKLVRTKAVKRKTSKKDKKKSTKEKKMKNKKKSTKTKKKCAKGKCTCDVKGACKRRLAKTSEITKLKKRLATLTRRRSA